MLSNGPEFIVEIPVHFDHFPMLNHLLYRRRHARRKNNEASTSLGCTRHLRTPRRRGLGGQVARQEAGDRGFSGGSYLITNSVSGTFFSRGVITLHADHTMSVIDSAQGGPTYFFTSQLGSWKMDGNGRIVARTIDFDYPPSADVARLDFTLDLSPDGSQVNGSALLTLYPLQDENPLQGEGTVLGTFGVAGELIKP